MRKYTVETLKKENELFDRCYGINNADVERVKKKKIQNFAKMPEYI